SGRVPAGLNHIVGLKPTRGLFSASGVFPACRSLDCVSIFAKTVSDAWAVTQVAAGFDASDGYSRTVPMLPVKTAGYRIAVPKSPEFYGDAQAQHAFEDTLSKLKKLPHIDISEIDFTPFKEAASLLYQGPWVAERLAAVGAFFESSKDAIDPVVAGIIGQGKEFSAVDTFNAQYRLADLRRQAETALANFDFMVVPTAPTFPSLADLQKNPVIRNSELGYYTNFVNFFDMAAMAIPATLRDDGLPFGITLVGPSGADHLLADAAQKLWHAIDTGKLNEPSVSTLPLPFSEPHVQVAVVGAHLTGQPLNWQLLECGARLVEATHTSGQYTLHALAGTTPPKPGLERVAQNGKPIALEVWDMPLRNFGNFVVNVPPPLVIGTIQLSDERWVKGFLCEPLALEGAKDITNFGGWRAYLDATSNAKSDQPPLAA
ncbi:MAG: allophanate hydrolase, partial [Burkholderiaceae bacterium]